MKFKCINEFVLEKCDADGFIIENEYVTIKENTIWETENINSDFIRLYNTNDDVNFWLEIPKDLLHEDFKQI